MDKDFLFAIANDENRKAPIPWAEILAGMRADDTEVAGAVYDIVTTDEVRKKIDPPLTDYELRQFIVGYLERCILTDPKGEWTLTRYGAAWEAQRYMLELWDREGGICDSLISWKKWMEKLYRVGDEGIKRAIVDGIMEHLFEEKGLRDLFADWKPDPQLKTAYDEAKLWADTQPNTAQSTE